MALCTHFTQNAWRKDLCANCFKSRGDHGGGGAGGGGAASAGAPRYLSSVCASRWRSLADGPLQAKAPLQGILRARAAATSAPANGPAQVSVTPRRRAANGTTHSVRFSPEQPQVIGEGGGDWPSDDEHNEENGDVSNGRGEGSGDDDDDCEEDEESRALQRLTRTNTHINAAPPEKELLNGSAEGAAGAAGAPSPRKPLALGRPLTGADGQRRAPLLVAVTPFGAGGGEERGSRIPVPARSRLNGAGAGTGAGAAPASTVATAAAATVASPAREKRRKEEENERQLRRKNSAEMKIDHVTTSESTTDDSPSSGIPAPKVTTKIISNGSTTNGPITNGPTTNGPISNGPILKGSITNGSHSNGPISNGPITNGVTTTISSSIKATAPSAVPRQVVGEDAPSSAPTAAQPAVADAKRPEKLLGTAAPIPAPTPALATKAASKGNSSEIITARAEPAVAKITGDITPPLKDPDNDSASSGSGDLARPDPDGRADPEGGPGEPPASVSAPATAATAPASATPQAAAAGPPPGIDPRPSFLHSRLPRGPTLGVASPNKPLVPAKPDVRMGTTGSGQTAGRQVTDARTQQPSSVPLNLPPDGKEKDKDQPAKKEEAGATHWSPTASQTPPASAAPTADAAHAAPATAAAASPTGSIPVQIPTVPELASIPASGNAAASAAPEAVARTPKRPAPRPPPTTPTSSPEMEEPAVPLVDEGKDDNDVHKENDIREEKEKEDKPPEEKPPERPTTLNIHSPQESIPAPITASKAPPPSSNSPQPQTYPSISSSTTPAQPPLHTIQPSAHPPVTASQTSTPIPTPAPASAPSATPTENTRPQKAPKPKFSLRKLLRLGGRGGGSSGASSGGSSGSGSGGGVVSAEAATAEAQAAGAAGQPTSPTRARPEIVHPLELRGSPERVDAPPRRSPQEPLYVNGGMVNAYNAGRPAQPPPPPRAPASGPAPASSTPTPTGAPASSRPSRPPPPRANSTPVSASGPRQPPPRTCGIIPAAALPAAAAGANSVDGLYANLGEARSALAPHKPQRSGSLREAPGGGSTGSADSDPGYEQVLNATPRPVSDSGESSNEPVYERVRSPPAPAYASASGLASPDGASQRPFLRSASLPACCGPLADALARGAIDALDALDPDALYASCSQTHQVGGGAGSRGRLRSRPALHRSLEDAYGAVVGANHEALAHALDRVTMSLSAPPPLPPAALRALRTSADAGTLRFAHFRPAPPAAPPTSPLPPTAQWVAAEAGGRRWARALWDATALQGVTGAVAGGACEVTLCVGAPGRGGLRAPALSARGLAHAALTPLAEFAATPEEVPAPLRTPTHAAPAATASANRDTVWVSVVAAARVETLPEYGQSLRVAADSGATDAAYRAAALGLLQLVNALKALQARGQEEASVSGFVVVHDDTSSSAADPPSSGDAATAGTARVVALPEAALLSGGCGGVAGARAAPGESLCACVDAALRALLPPGAPLLAPLHSLLEQERADSLSRAQAALEFALWGPAPSPAPASAAEEEEALQRWLDLERAAELRALVDTLTAAAADAPAAAAAAAAAHCKSAATSAPGTTPTASGTVATVATPAAGAPVAERCRLWFLVRTSARVLADAARLLREGQTESSVITS